MPVITEAAVGRRLNSLRSLSYLENTWELVASWKFPSHPTWQKPDRMRSGFSLSCSNRTLLVIKILKYFSTSRQIAIALKGFSSILGTSPTPSPHDSALNSVWSSSPRALDPAPVHSSRILVSEISTVTYWLLSILNITPTWGPRPENSFVSSSLHYHTQLQQKIDLQNPLVIPNLFL